MTYLLRVWNLKDLMISKLFKKIGKLTRSSQISVFVDKNECDVADDHDCDANAKCINIVGSFRCDCNDGNYKFVYF